MQIVLDGHRDKIASKTVSDGFGGFHVVVDGKTNYPFTSRNGISLRTGQANEVLIRATEFEADPRVQTTVSPMKRNCYFHDEHPRNYPMKMHQYYTQTNCFFECKLKLVHQKRNANNVTGKTCIPWFYPKEDKYLFDVCDPWETKEFQNMLKNVNDTDCHHCLPDCKSTNYQMSLSSAPFGTCERGNLGLSPMCDLSTKSDMIMNPPIWRYAIDEEYNAFNGKNIPDFLKEQKNILPNIRYFASDEDSTHLTMRAQHERNPSYDALDDDITIVNFYFDEPDIVQYLKYLRMTPIDFISKVSLKRIS